MANKKTTMDDVMSKISKMQEEIAKMKATKVSNNYDAEELEEERDEEEIDIDDHDYTFTSDELLLYTETVVAKVMEHFKESPSLDSDELSDIVDVEHSYNTIELTINTDELSEKVESIIDELVIDEEFVEEVYKETKY